MLIKVGAKQYKITYDLNTICDFEDLTNTDVSDMTARKLSGLRYIRALLFCGLKVNHPELELADAGNILNEYIKNGKDIKSLYEIIFGELEKLGFSSNKSNNQNYNNREKKRNNYHSKNNV